MPCSFCDRVESDDWVTVTWVNVEEGVHVDLFCGSDCLRRAYS
jgi:hypothetical protein